MSSAGTWCLPSIDSLTRATDRSARISNPNEVQLEGVAALLRLLEKVHIRSTAKSGFKRACFAADHQFAKLAQEKSSSLECNRFRLERRKSPRDFIGIQETNHADARQKEQSSFRRVAETSTRVACAPQTSRLRVNLGAFVQEFFPLFLHS